MVFSILEKIIPLDNRQIIFGSDHGNRASDNSWALFEHIVSTDSDLYPIWITKNKSLYKKLKKLYPKNIVLAQSFRGVFCYLRSKQVVISHSYLDMCLMPYTKKKIIVYLWHGTPIRKIGMMLKGEELEYSAEIAKHWHRWNRKLDFFFASSDYEANIIRQAFPSNDFELRVTGYPRNDPLILHRGKDPVRDQDGRFTILFAPTYRINKTGKKEIFAPFMHPEITQEEMDDFLQKRDSKLIVRPHPLVEIPDINSKNIEYVTAQMEPDISSLFIRSDLFITDYSSSYFDWLILERPAIMSVPDLMDYENKMGLINGLEEICVGDVVHDKQSLLDSLARAITSERIQTGRKGGNTFNIYAKMEPSCPIITKLLRSNII